MEAILEHQFYWAPTNDPGLEHLHFRDAESGYMADAFLLRWLNGHPIRLYYRIACDQSWRTRDVFVQLLSSPGQELALQADGEGNWTSKRRPFQSLKGCLDIDRSATPFTNTLPIRRLNLKPGESAVIEVAYVSIPDLKVKKVSQRYTCREKKAKGGVYRYQGLSTGFEAELTTDKDGFVVQYPSVFDRVH